jgi:hypothetical protein
LQSKCLLTTSSSTSILGLVRILDCNDSLEGLIGDSNVDVFFRPHVYSCVEKLSCVSKEILGIKVNAYNFIGLNNCHVLCNTLGFP